VAFSSIFSADYKETPYWWDALPNDLSTPDDRPLPKRADILIVGAGLTGVAAAWELAQAGRSVVVIDTREPGQGASSRNAGMLGRHCLISLSELIETHGVGLAQRYFKELDEAYQQAIDRIVNEKLDCDFRRQGRFIGAFTPAHHESLVREYALRTKHIGEEAPRVIPSNESVSLGSAQYAGGIWLPNYANVQPAKYHYSMLGRARQAGANVLGKTTAFQVERRGKSFTARTSRGQIEVAHVIIATNGYTGSLTPWLKRRLSPINAYMVATETLPDELTNAILAPRGTYTDTRKNPNNIQISPDGRRLLLGGRTARVHSSLKNLAQHLHHDIVDHFPNLRDIKISHAWTGRCAATRDFFPHLGEHDGIHYALGYNFAGITVGPYLGTKIAKKILGSADASTVFDDLTFPSRPWLTRQPWAIHLYMGWQVGKDRHH
jgi:glycine/D-amino acid oxidase-like deaminating enzyme